MGFIGLSAVLESFSYVLGAYQAIIDYIGAPELAAFGIVVIVLALIFAFTHDKSI